LDTVASEVHLGVYIQARIPTEERAVLRKIADLQPSANTIAFNGSKQQDVGPR
jgi:hypothetical protein